MAKMKQLFIPILFSICLLSACSKEFQGINNDPNNPTDAPASAMLTGVLVANMNLQEGELARAAGMWTGYFKGQQQQYLNYYQYTMRATNFDATWQNVYSGAYKNIKILKQKALALNNLRMVGVSQVIEANVMATAADLWGDIPYKEACDENFPNPTYDAQLDVYKRVQLVLDSAIVNLGSTSFVDFAAQDIHFAGNMTKWIQTANTLKARYYLHVRDYANAVKYALLGINTAANNWMAPHNALGKGAYNQYYQFFASDRPAWMDANGVFFVGLVNAAAPTTYRGNTKTIEKSRMAYLCTGTTNLNYTTNGFFGQTSPFPLATYAENLLILAEADTRLNGFAAGLTRLNAFRAYMTTGGYIGATYLTAGNYKYDPYVIADFDPGGIENPVAKAVTPVEALLREILEERYITFIGTFEGFNDMRRTFKETAIKMPIPVNFGSSIPQRMLYPQVEVDRNTSMPTAYPTLFTPTPVNQ